MPNQEKNQWCEEIIKYVFLYSQRGISEVELVNKMNELVVSRTKLIEVLEKIKMVIYDYELNNAINLGRDFWEYFIKEIDQLKQCYSK